MCVFRHDPCTVHRSVFADYTYPPLQGVIAGKKVSIDIAQPCTPEQRQVYRRILQNHFNLNPQRDIEELDVIAPRLPIFFPASLRAAESPKGYAAIANFRQFFIDVAMPPSAFAGSHRLGLEVALGGVRVPLGSVSVLSRLDPGRCANCVQRGLEPTPVRGRIMLPAAVALALVDKPAPPAGAGHMIPHTAPSDGPDLRGFKASFSAQIATPGSARLASADETVPVGMIPNGVQMGEDAAPKATLWSAAVAHPEDDMDGAVKFFDWKDHGEIFDTWVTPLSAVREA
jgi:tyrosinase